VCGSLKCDGLTVLKVAGFLQQGVSVCVGVSGPLTEEGLVWAYGC
jgi:hypothetical protein